MGRSDRNQSGNTNQNGNYRNNGHGNSGNNYTQQHRDSGNSQNNGQGQHRAGNNRQFNGNGNTGNHQQNNGGRQNQNRQNGSHQQTRQTNVVVSETAKNTSEVDDGEDMMVLVSMQVNNTNRERTDSIGDEEESETEVYSDDEERITKIVPTLDYKSNKSIIMMTLEVPVYDINGKQHMAVLLFDTGSNYSYVRKEFADQLQLKAIGTEQLKLQTFASEKAQILDSNIYELRLKTETGSMKLTVSEIERIASNVLSATMEPNDIDNILEGTSVMVREKKTIDILIGLDYYMKMMEDASVVPLHNGLYVHRTQFGTVISGVETELNQQDRVVVEVDKDKNDEFTEVGKLLSRFWEMESMGIVDNPKQRDDETTNAYFRTTTIRDSSGRYEVRLPFVMKENIPSNRALAFYRLKSILKRLEKDATLMEQYGNIFKEQLKLGFIEEVEDESVMDGQVIHYLGHQPVIKENSKSTKVRIVFDGSARMRKGEKSLNEHLYTGQSLLPSIPGVLLRIRRRKYLISADIAKAFLQLGLHIEDRDATRFLWISEDDGRIKCYRFARVPFGLKSSPFLLNSVVRLHVESYGHQWAKDMLRSVYVDNIYIGLDDIDEAKEFYFYSKEIFKDACMNLCQYVSNDETLNQFFEQMEKSKEDEMQKLLGVQWNTKNDELVFNMPKFDNSANCKRQALKQIASCYDPLGWLSPVLLSGKLFFQELCSTKEDWDSKLSDIEIRRWDKIMQSWRGDEMKVPRQFFDADLWNKCDRCELHIFTDASKVAFGSVAYLRILTIDGRAASQFLMAKGRIAPKSPVHSIPQLEMAGIVTGVRLARFILKEIDIDISETFVWSDAKSSLDLVASNRSSNRFMANRVKEINEIGKQYTFTHIPGTLNPADLLTRGCTFEQLKMNKVWQHGPLFLSSIEPLPLKCSSGTDDVSEKDRVAMRCETVHKESSRKYEAVMDPSRFSSFHRLLRTMMTILYFLHRKSHPIVAWAKEARQKLYHQAQLIDPPSKETIESLQLQKWNELWVYKGRVKQRQLVFLPHGTIARLLVRDIHEQYGHISTAFTLAKLRETVWITQGRSFVKKIVKSCKGCKRFDSRPYRQPKFADFPISRIKATRPFESTGVDYCGPLHVKVGNEVQPIWIILFTCLYSRFTVTEVVQDMTTTRFLHALRRLAAVFGVPQTIIADNAKQFHMLNDVIIQVNDQSSFGGINTTTLPTFKFIPAHSPWAGGVYERIIGLIKRLLTRAGASKRLMEIEEFKTTLMECTGIINERPLSYISSEDDIEPLTPHKCVYIGSSEAKNMTISEVLDRGPWNHQRLVEEWQMASEITKDFQNRWNREYVQILQDRRDFYHRQKFCEKTVPKIGDVVLIENPRTSDKAKWTMAKIVEVKKASAIIKNGRTKRTGEYPFKMLYPLESSLEAEEDNLEEKQEVSEVGEDSQIRKEQKQPEKEQPRTGIRRSPRLASKLGLAAITFLGLCTFAQGLETENVSTTATSLEHYSHEEIISAKDWFRIMTLWTQIMVGLFIIHAAIGVFQMITTMMSTMIVIGKFVGQIGWKTFRGVGSIIGRIWQCVCCERSVRRRMRRRSKIFIAILLTSTLVRSLMGCSDIASIQATDNVCVDDGTNTTCNLNTVSILNLVPNGSIGCFRVEMDRQVQTFLEIQITAIASKCNEQVHYFQREYEIKHEWVHRCASAGSCTGSKCEQLGPNDDIPEFSHLAKTAPGFGRCHHGCGCITCNYCFLCSPSCIFSRIFAQPTSERVFEIYSCPTWTVNLEAKVNYNGKVTKHRLENGQPLKIGSTNISIVSTGFSIPQSPIHSANFIRVWNKKGEREATGYTSLSLALAGRPTSGSLGEFQCESKTKAEKFDCIFDESICKCNPMGTSVRCSCKKIDLAKIVNDTLLPREKSGISFSVEENQLITRTTTSSMVSVQVVYKNQSIKRVVRKDKCVVEILGAQGCYGCSTGAHLESKCTSTHHQVKAYVNCKAFTFYVSCDQNGTINGNRILYNQENVYLNCSVNCGGQNTWFNLNATLFFQASFQKQSQEFVSFSERIFGTELGFIDSLWENATNMWNSLFDYIGKLVFFGFICILLVWLLVTKLRILYRLASFWRECQKPRYLRKDKVHIG